MTALRGITWDHPRGYDCMVAASAQYCRANPEVEIVWERRSLLEFGDAPLEDLVPDYDLLVIDHPHVPAAARDGLLASLDGQGHDGELETLAAQSVGRSHPSYLYGGHQYGLAVDAAAQVAAYRPDLIASPPSTWGEVIELAREGRVLWPAKPVDAFSSLVTISGAHGWSPLASPDAFLRREQLLAVLELMHELAALVPAENLAQNPIEISEALAVSDTACYSPLLFGYSNYARDGFRTRRLAYTNVPAGPAGVAGSLLGGAGVAVSASSAAREQATAFAFWVAGAEAQRGVYFDAGGQPGNAAAWDDERTNAVTHGFFRDTRETLEGAYLRPQHPRYIDVQNRVAPMITGALRGEISDERLATILDDEASCLRPVDPHTLSTCPQR